MLSKNQIKAVQSLKQKKFRDEHGLFIAEGTKIVPELLASPIRVKEVFCTREFLASRKLPAGIQVTEVKEQELERISALSAPNAVLAVCEIPSHVLEVSAIREKLSLALDDIRDPGNLGTIVRIADWFGIENIICSEETADLFNPKAVQSTMGSIARVKVHYTDLGRFLKSAGFSLPGQGFPVYGALLDGKNIYSEKLSAAGLIVIGNESKGISEGVQELLTDKISIPSFSKGRASAESLNAAVATAVICSEFRRRAH